MYYERNQDIGQAIACFNKVIEIDPLSGEGYINMGAVLEKEKKYPEALGWYKKAIEIAPNNSGYQLAYAKLLRETNQLDLAIETFAEILSQFPDDGILYYEISQTYLLNNQPDQAIQVD